MGQFGREVEALAARLETMTCAAQIDRPDERLRIAQVIRAMRAHEYFKPPARFADAVVLDSIVARVRPREAVAYCVAWSRGIESRAPMLSGPAGCGKTALMYWALRELFRWKADRLARRLAIEPDLQRASLSPGWTRALMPAVVVASGAELAADLRAVKQEERAERWMGTRRMKHQDAPQIVAVDDIESAGWTDWWGEQLYLLLDRRYLDDATTIVTTNLSAQDLAKHVGDRIARRILEPGRLLALSTMARPS